MCDDATVVYSVCRDGGIATRQAVPTAAVARAHGRCDRPRPSMRNMPNLRNKLREAIIAYMIYLETGERRQQMEYQTFTDPQFGESYSPMGTIECIVIRGPDAVERLEPLRRRLREATEAAYADETLRAAADALTTGIPFLPVGADMSVNRSNIIDEHDPVTGKKRPFCEYVRATVLDVLERALGRIGPEPDVPPLSPQATAVYEILLQLPAHRAMTGRELIAALNARHMPIEQSTLTSRIIPALEPYGVESVPRIGYRIPASRRPTPTK